MKRPFDNRATATIALAMSGDAPPREVRLFKAGWNDTSKGRFLFDAKAAKAVMAAYRKHGILRMIDLEHLSLDTESKNYDPDARAWFRLQVRNGELWAVDVKWTPDGVARLRARSQRYLSPAFDFDRKSKRILAIFNVALTALPATHEAMALVAASSLGGTMDPDLAKKALDIIESGDANAALELVKSIAAGAMGGGEAPPETEGEGETDPAEGMADDPPAEEEEQASETSEEDEEAPAAMAAASKLLRLTGKATLGAAVDEVERIHAIAVDVEQREAKLATERAALEAGERRALVASLVKLGVEIPATAWESPTAKTLKPCKRLAGEPIAELRDRVAKLSAARGGKRPDVRPPAGGSGGDADGGQEFETEHGTIRLSASAIAECKKKKIDPAIVAETRAAIRARSTNARMEA